MHTSLGEEGDELLETFTAPYCERFMQGREARLNHDLRTGDRMEQVVSARRTAPRRRCDAANQPERVPTVEVKKRWTSDAEVVIGGAAEFFRRRGVQNR